MLLDTSPVDLTVINLALKSCLPIMFGCNMKIEDAHHSCSNRTLAWGRPEHAGHGVEAGGLVQPEGPDPLPAVHRVPRHLLTGRSCARSCSWHLKVMPNTETQLSFCKHGKALALPVVDSRNIAQAGARESEHLSPCHRFNEISLLSKSSQQQGDHVGDLFFATHEPRVRPPPCCPQFSPSPSSAS